MNSYNHSLWSSSPFSNQYSDLIQRHENLFQFQQYYDPSQKYVMSYSDYSTSNHSVSPDYDSYPKFSSIYPSHVERSQSPTRINESSSGIDMNYEESIEAHSSNSDCRIIRCYSSSLSSPSPCSRRVIIKPTKRTVEISNKPSRRQRRQRYYRRKQRKSFFYEKELISKKQSPFHLSKQNHHQSSYRRYEHKEDKLRRLYDEYSSEEVHREWKPLTATESRELYQYALDKYHRKSRSN